MRQDATVLTFPHIVGLDETSNRAEMLSARTSYEELGTVVVVQLRAFDGDRGEGAADD
jgi:hypothetical protein